MSQVSRLAARQGDARGARRHRKPEPAEFFLAGPHTVSRVTKRSRRVNQNSTRYTVVRIV